MRHWVLLLLLAITVAVIAYVVVWIFTGRDNGLDPEEPDGRAVPLPGNRPLVESDIADVRFDSVARGYRMGQVDAALRRAAYDIGYKQELIDVLEAEVIALRDGRAEDAEALRQAREGAVGGLGGSTTLPSASTTERAGDDGAQDDRDDSADHDRAASSATSDDDAAPGADAPTTHVAGDARTDGGRPNATSESTGDQADRPVGERAATGR
jgi:DivIVA domain-containing protein